MRPQGAAVATRRRRMMLELLLLLLLSLATAPTVAPQPLRREAAAAADAPTTHLQPIPLSGCWQTGFTAAVLVGSQRFQLLLDLSSSAVALATPACLDCHHVAPMYEARGGGGAAARTETEWRAARSYPDGSAWEGAVYRDTLSLLGSSDTPVSPTPLPMLVAGISSVAHAHGYFFPVGTCADLGARKAGSYQGILGVGPRPVAVAATDGGNGNNGAAGTAHTESWFDRMHTENPSMPNMLSLQVHERGGQLLLGGGMVGGDPNAAAAHDSFLSLYTGRMRYTTLLRPWEGVFALDVVSVSLSMHESQKGDWSPTSPSPPAALPFDGAGVLDSSAPGWELPPALFRSLTRQIDSHPFFARVFRARAFWNRGECAPLPPTLTTTAEDGGGGGGTMSVGELQRQLPRLTLTMRDGLRLTVGALGSYIVPCDPEHRGWGPGLRRGLDGAGEMRLGWPFLNHFLLQLDLEAGVVGVATTATTTSASSPFAALSSASVSSCTPGWTGAGSSGAQVAGGILGACGTGGGIEGAMLAMLNECVSSDSLPPLTPAAATHSTTDSPPVARSCAPASDGSPNSGVLGGSCSLLVPVGSSCSFSCAPGFSARFSRPWRCEPHWDGLGAERRHGAQECEPVEWVLRRASAGTSGAMGATMMGRPVRLRSGAEVSVQWRLPSQGVYGDATKATRDLSIGLFSAPNSSTSDAGTAALSPLHTLFHDPSFPPSSVNSTRLSDAVRFTLPETPSGQLRLLHLQAAVDGKPWGSKVEVLLLPMDAPVEEEELAQEQHTPLRTSRSLASLPAQEASLDPTLDVAAEAEADTDASSSSSSSTGASYIDPPTAASATQVLLRTSYPYSALSSNDRLRDAFRLSLLQELSALRRVRVTSMQLLRSDAEEGGEGTDVEMVLRAIAAGEEDQSGVSSGSDGGIGSDSGHVEALVGQLHAAASLPSDDATTRCAGTVLSFLTGVESDAQPMQRCADGIWRRSCEQSEGTSAPAVESNALRNGLLVGLGLLLFLVLCVGLYCCYRRRRPSRPSGPGGAHSKLQQVDSSAGDAESGTVEMQLQRQRQQPHPAAMPSDLEAVRVVPGRNVGARSPSGMGAVKADTLLVDDHRFRIVAADDAHFEAELEHEEEEHEHEHSEMHDSMEAVRPVWHDGPAVAGAGAPHPHPNDIESQQHEHEHEGAHIDPPSRGTHVKLSMHDEDEELSEL